MVNKKIVLCLTLLRLVLLVSQMSNENFPMFALIESDSKLVKK